MTGLLGTHSVCITRNEQPGRAHHTAITDIVIGELRGVEKCFISTYALVYKECTV